MSLILRQARDGDYLHRRFSSPLQPSEATVLLWTREHQRGHGNRRVQSVHISKKGLSTRRQLYQTSFPESTKLQIVIVQWFKAQADTQRAPKAAGFIHKGEKCIDRNNIGELL